MATPGSPEAEIVAFTCTQVLLKWYNSTQNTQTVAYHWHRLLLFLVVASFFSLCSNRPQMQGWVGAASPACTHL